MRGDGADILDPAYAAKLRAESRERGASIGAAFSAPKPNGVHAPPPARPKGPSADPGISLAALMAADFPPPRFVVDGVLTEGLTLFAGPPKKGKSWFGLQVAIGVAAGVPVLGKLATRDGGRDVLALFLEDTKRRIRDRAGKLLRATGWPAAERLDIRTHWPRANQDGLSLIGEWLAARPGALVIVDTLQKFRAPAAGKGTGYAEDYEAIGGLKQVADLYGAAVLVIHHTTKGGNDDPFASISGTLGLTGAADSLLVLERPDGQAGGAMYTTGRDLSEQTLTMGFEPAAGLWTVTACVDGIDRQAAASHGPNRPEQCEAWLRGFVGRWAWPDREVVDAGKAAGFTFDNIKSAKAALRSASPPLRSKPAYSGGPWMVWFGDAKPSDRPPSSLSPSLPTCTTYRETPDKHQTPQMAPDSPDWGACGESGASGEGGGYQ